MFVSAKVIAHSQHKGKPLITLELKYPRYIHSEFMTHRCLPADTELYFDLPSGGPNSEYRLYKMTIGEFHDKWVNGAAERTPSRQRDLDLNLISDTETYSARELSEIYDISVSSVRKMCRDGRLVSQNLTTKERNEDFLILGSDFKEYRNSPKNYRQNHKARLQAMRIRALDVDTGEVIHTNITDIWEVGDKELYELKAGTYVIRGTHDHPIYTQRGWVNLSEITESDSVAVVSNLQQEKKDPNELKKVEGKWRSVWQNQMRQKLSLAQNGHCSQCGDETDLEIHHIIPVYQDPSKCFDESNVVAICNSCHKKEHEVQGWQQGNPLTASFIKVDSVVNTGEVETVYDLSVADKNHNFVANGIVVHNCFSRNASSSRAIPVKRMLANIKSNIAKPLYWGENKSGMQAGEELTGLRLWLAKKVWSLSCRTACFFSSLLAKLGLHKQHTNRITEPFQYITVLVTSTEWDNFFQLRNHEDAQPEIAALGKAIYKAIRNSTPTLLNQGDWHLPYITREDVQEMKGDIPTLCAISAARCARVSYLNHENKRPTLEEDLELFKRLTGSQPMHLSPTEHQATPSHKGNTNFDGWRQFRYRLENPEI